MNQKRTEKIDAILEWLNKTSIACRMREKDAERRNDYLYCLGLNIGFQLASEKVCKVLHELKYEE